MQCSDAVKNRVKRTAGQLQGILKMMEDERSCSDVVMQLAAVKANVEALIGIITTENLLNKIESDHGIVCSDVDDEVALIIKNMK